MGNLSSKSEGVNLPQQVTTFIPQSKTRFQQNPFICAPQTRAKDVLVGTSSHALVDVDSGEIQGGTYIFKTQEVDKESFVKLYTAELYRWLDLSKSGQKLFNKILQIVSKEAINKDFIQLSFENCSDIMSKKTFYKSTAELIQIGIIAKGNYDTSYWINPAIFFNGNRVTFAKQLRLKQSEQARKDKPPENLELFTE